MKDEEIDKELARVAAVGRPYAKELLDYINRLKAKNEQIRKETAREIYDFAHDFFEWDEEGFCRELASLLKQKYGVEVNK